jgi:hypothetical protein
MECDTRTRHADAQQTTVGGPRNPQKHIAHCRDSRRSCFVLKTGHLEGCRAERSVCLVLSSGEITDEKTWEEKASKDKTAQGFAAGAFGWHASCAHHGGNMSIGRDRRTRPGTCRDWTKLLTEDRIQRAHRPGAGVASAVLRWKTGPLPDPTKARHATGRRGSTTPERLALMREFGNRGRSKATGQGQLSSHDHEMPRFYTRACSESAVVESETPHH